MQLKSPTTRYGIVLLAALAAVVGCNSGSGSLLSGSSGDRAGATHNSQIKKHPAPCQTTLGPYIFNGYRVYGSGDLYGSGAKGDPVLSANASCFSPDPNSDSIMTTLAHGGVAIDNAPDDGLERINAVGGSTLGIDAECNGAISAGESGHCFLKGSNNNCIPPQKWNTCSPLSDNTVVDGTGIHSQDPIEWESDFYFEGTHTPSCPTSTSDCHWVVYGWPYVYEGGGGNYSPSPETGKLTFTTYDGYIDDITDTYASQLGDKLDNCHVSGIACFGTTDYPHDMLSGYQPAHPLAIEVSTPYVWPNGGVNYARGVGGDGYCSTSISKCLVEGDILVLKAGAANTPQCNPTTSDPQITWVITQISTLGEVLVDTGMDTNAYFALNATDGSHFWHPDVWACLNSLPFSKKNYYVVWRNHYPQITPTPTPNPPYPSSGHAGRRTALPGRRG